MDDDPIPELHGPQTPAVSAVLDRLHATRRTRGGLPYIALEESLRDFEVACSDLDHAQFAYMGKEITSSEEYQAEAARVRSRVINYFNHGYSLLDAIAYYSARTTWQAYVDSFDAPDAIESLRAPARILAVRLYAARHIVAAHRRGWSVPGMVIGAGTGVLQRRPSEFPSPDAGLVERMVATLDRLGLEPFRDPGQGIQIASTVIAARAADCDRQARRLHHELINIYGVQTSPVSKITPSVVALMDQVIGA